MLKQTHEDLKIEEIKREQEMRSRGKQRYDDRLDRAIPSTQNNPANIITEALPRVANDIVKRISLASETAGRPPKWLKDIKHIDPYVLAMIGLNTILDGVARGASRNSTQVLIGQRIELENIKVFLEKSESKKWVGEVEDKIKIDCQKFYERRMRMQSIASKSGYNRKSWNAERHVRASETIVNAVLSSSKVFDEWSVIVNKKTKNRFGMLPEASKRLADLNYDASWQSPILEPMIDVPNDWTSFTTGGYYDEQTAALGPLVKSCSYSQRTTIDHQLEGGKMPKYLEALNIVQKTPLAINDYTLRVIEWAWENEKDISKFPTKKKIPVEPYPKNFKKLSLQEQQLLKANRKKVEIKNREVDGHIASMALDLRVANELSDYPFCYIVWQFCTRGRIYPASSFNYHREDAIKSLFNLGKGKVLDDNGLYWLLVHIANVGDFDKISKQPLEDRVQWSVDNEDLLLSVGVNYKDTFEIWSKADKPFQFLAACNAYVKYKFSPDTYECGLPVSLDGSSSGTQHFSAASLSKSDGKLVNLTNEEKPQDLYGVVAEWVEAKVRQLLRHNNAIDKDGKDGQIVSDKTREIAKAWLTPIKIMTGGKEEVVYPGITRALVKRNVMTYGYSSVKYGFADQLMEDTISKIDAKVIRGELDRNPFGETEAEQRQSAAFMASINYDGVQRILSSVSAGMKFFSGVAGILAHEGKHVKFKNKIDFPMQQKYTHWQVKKVRIFLYDRVASLAQDKPIHRRSQLSVRTQNPRKVDKKKSKSAVSANLIHSQDSCHLLSTVLHMEREYELKNFFLIHDAFATVPNDVEYMYTAVRESFINLYKDYCLFSDVASQASKQLTDAGQLKLLNLEIPTKGDLDLMAVKDAQYCFC